MASPTTKLEGIHDQLCAVLDDLIGERDALPGGDPRKATAREMGKRVDKALDHLDKALDRVRSK